MHTWESNFSNFVIEYLGETETEFQNTLLNFFGGIILFKLGTSIESENKITLEVQSRSRKHLYEDSSKRKNSHKTWS